MILTEAETGMVHSMRAASNRRRILDQMRHMQREDALVLLVEAMAELAPELLEFLKRIRDEEISEEKVSPDAK